MGRNDRRGRLQALGEGLKAMFRELESRPLPDRVVSVVEQLDGAETPAPVETPRASQVN